MIIKSCWRTSAEEAEGRALTCFASPVLEVLAKCCWISGLILEDEVGTRRSGEAILRTVAMWETYISSALFWPLKAS